MQALCDVCVVFHSDIRIHIIHCWLLVDTVPKCYIWTWTKKQRTGIGPVQNRFRTCTVSGWMSAVLGTGYPIGDGQFIPVLPYFYQSWVAFEHQKWKLLNKNSAVVCYSIQDFPHSAVARHVTTTAAQCPFSWLGLPLGTLTYLVNPGAMCETLVWVSETSRLVLFFATGLRHLWLCLRFHLSETGEFSCIPLCMMATF